MIIRKNKKNASKSEIKFMNIIAGVQISRQTTLSTPFAEAQLSFPKTLDERNLSNTHHKKRRT